MTDIHHTARQTRSADTEERIVAAARELLKTHSMEEMKMADIAAHAGVSIGGLYARFPSKEALAVFVAGKRVFEELEKQAAHIIDDGDAGAEDVVRRYMATAAALYRRNRSLLRAVYVATRTGTDETLRARVRGFNLALHERLRGAILERCPGASATRVNLGILSMMSVLREAVLFGQPVSDLARLSEQELVDELTVQFLAYTGCKPPRRKKK
ncbi:MAG TPA: TetR/AcrR family transcriptional regulator [Thermoanaerobaculia bacterium]|jgi:AcrR family transcriptional regulator